MIYVLTNTGRFTNLYPSCTTYQEGAQLFEALEFPVTLSLGIGITDMFWEGFIDSLALTYGVSEIYNLITLTGIEKSKEKLQYLLKNFDF